MRRFHIGGRGIGHVSFELWVAVAGLEFGADIVGVFKVVGFGLEVAWVGEQVPEAQKTEVLEMVF